MQITQHLGTGTASATISFDFPPKFVIVQKKNSVSVVHEATGNVINGGVVVSGYGGTKGLSLTGSSLVLSYSASMSDGFRANLNESGGQYIIIAFR